MGTPHRVAGGGSIAELLTGHPVILPTADSSVRIAFDALQLLSGDLGGVPDNAAGAKLKALKEAYEGGDADDVLYISKGIHQPRSNPHMQLQLKRGKGTWYTYHLNVTMAEDLIDGLAEDYFHWVGVQFTAEATSVYGNQQASWPLVATMDVKGRHNRRRQSIAPKNVQARIEAIARAEQEERERQEKIENARLAEQARALTRNTISARLQALNYTIQGDKMRSLNKLVDGQSIKVKTLRSKELTVKWERGNVQTVTA